MFETKASSSSAGAAYDDIGCHKRCVITEDRLPFKVAYDPGRGSFAPK